MEKSTLRKVEFPFKREKHDPFIRFLDSIVLLVFKVHY